MNFQDSPPVESTGECACHRALITGATGFVGKALANRLRHDDRFVVRAAVRIESKALPAEIEQSVMGDFAPDTDWRTTLKGIDTVVHLAARVHVMNDAAVDPLSEFRRANVEVTLNLARQAADAGVRRFVFLSSVKVNGEGGFAGQASSSGDRRHASDMTLYSNAYRESDAPAPQDAYGLSKHEAETGLRQLAEATKMEIVIIRPPLVYGPGVRANFKSLTHAIGKGIPLPFGATTNARSLVGLGNLVDFIIVCMQHPAAAQQTFLVSDGEDISIRELICRIACAMGRPARLIPVPASVLMAGAIVLGKRSAAHRLLGSLQVDIAKARQVLGWIPPFSMAEELKRTFSTWPEGR